MHEHAVLHHLAATPELQHPGADGRVVHASEVTGQLLIGDADGSGDGAELGAQELAIRAADVSRVGELDVLAGLQNLQRSGLQTGECDAVAIGGTFAHQVVLGVLSRHKPGKHRSGFLAHQFGVVVLVEFVELDQGPRQPRLAPDLTGTQDAEQVDDFLRIDAHRVHSALARHRGQTTVLGMRAVQVVGHAPSQPVELDAGTYDVARRQISVEADRQVLGLQQLKLQGHHQSVLRATGAQPDQALAAFQHCAAGERLQAVEVGLASGVGFLRPVAPQRLHIGLESLIRR